MSKGSYSSDLKRATRSENVFKPASWLSKIDFINHLILFNNVLMAVLAENKGGKSSFIALVQASLDLHTRSTVIHLTSPYDREKLMSDIAEAFHLKGHTDMASIVSQINERKAQTLLMIDDAQYLEDEWILEALSAIKHQGTQGYFHLCLVSDFSIVATLNQLMDGQFKNLIHTIELSGLNEAETKTYILHRAQLEGFDTSILTDEIVHKIYKVTSGDLSKINRNLSTYIQTYLAEPKRKKTKLLKRTSIAATVVLTATALSQQFMEKRYHYPLASSTPTTVATLELPRPVLPSLIPPVADLSPKITAQLAKKQSAPVKAAPHRPTVLSSSLPQFRENAKIQKITASTPHQVAVILSEDEEVRPGMVLMDKVVYIPKIMAPQGSVIKNKQAFNKRAGSLNPIDKVNVADEKRYTIQIVASNNEQHLKRFAQRHKLSKNTKIYRVMVDNKYLYVLTLGQYNSFTRAKNDMQRLSREISKLNPWIRPTEGLVSQRDLG